MKKSDGIYISIIVSLFIVVFGSVYAETLGHPYDYWIIGLLIFGFASLLCYFFYVKDSVKPSKGSCIIEKKVFRRKLVYEDRTRTFFTGFILLGISIGIGFFQEMYDSSMDEKYPIDFWSISHFFISFAIYTMLDFFLRNKKTAFIVTFTIVVIYEPIEAFLFPLLGFASEFYHETILNIIGDIIVDFFGVIAGFFFSRKDGIC